MIYIGFDVDGNPLSHFFLAKTPGHFGVLDITRAQNLFARVLIPGDGKLIHFNFVVKPSCYYDFY